MLISYTTFWIMKKHPVVHLSTNYARNNGNSKNRKKDS